jgi:alpha-glucosidase
MLKKRIDIDQMICAFEKVLMPTLTYPLKSVAMLLLILALNACTTSTPEFVLSSPGEVNTVNIWSEDGEINYDVSHGPNKVIVPSRLGLSFKNAPSLASGLKIIDSNVQHIDKAWQQPWGEVKTIRNNYNEGTISLVSVDNAAIQIALVFRAYDDGIAFRYHVKNLNGIEEVIIDDEITEFNLAEDAQSWWIKAYQPNRYEYLYQTTKISKIDTVHTPLTMRFENGTHVSIHEAALAGYSSMQIAGRKSTKLYCDLAPWSNGDKVRTSIPFKTPWRTIKITDSASELASSYLTLNCNEPNRLEDVSWIHPSKYIGIWWGMIIGKWTWKEGLRHGATTARGKEYIDFAAKHGFDEVLIEGISAGFQGLFPGDTVTTSFTESTADFNLNEVQAYAQSKGVSLQSYQETSASPNNYLIQVDSAFALLQRLGIDKAKIGHVGALLDKKEYHYGQYAVEYYRRVLEKAAEYKIGVNFHEPIKDTGERRTFPNMLSREGARGMEYNSWGNGGNPPNHVTTLAFTRLLEAPMDFTPGIFDLLYQNMDADNTDQFPVEIKLIDQGNGYSNVIYKGSESYWQSKKMTREVKVVGGDTTFVWTVMTMMKAGEWEWGIRAHDFATDDNNIWLLGTLDMPNSKITVAEDGTISGDVSITIPNQGLDPNDRITASNADLVEIGNNVFGKTQRVNTTLAKQLAYYVVIYSPIQMASDFIENYVDQPAFQFIKDVPVDWEETVVLNGEIGEFITVARKDRNSKDWYLGSITNDKPRLFDIDLSFLDQEANYEAEYYADGENADWELNPYDMQIGSEEVGDIYRVKLAKGGGHAVRFKYQEN